MCMGRGKGRQVIVCVGGGRAEACGSHVGGTTHAEWEVYLIGCGEEEGQFWLNEEPVLGHRVGGGQVLDRCVCVCVCVCTHARTCVSITIMVLL